jgi:hypothetical protein
MKKKIIFCILFVCITTAAIIFKIDVITNENGYYIDENNKILFIIEKGEKALTVSTIFYCREPQLYILG